MSFLNRVYIIFLAALVLQVSQERMKRSRTFCAWYRLFRGEVSVQGLIETRITVMIAAGITASIRFVLARWAKLQSFGMGAS